MRFVVAAIAAFLSTQAGAVELACSSAGWTDNEFTCAHPRDTSLPYSEIHLDQPGTFNATIAFASPLLDQLMIEGERYSHFDVYTDAGQLVAGNSSYWMQFLSMELPAGLTGFSFQYSVPEFGFGTEPDYYTGSPIDNTVVQGTENYFKLSSNGLPRFTFNISPVASSAVPEPTTWAMLIAGFGMIGATARRQRRLAAA